jgi:gliding motility-associated lipoprotein GldH
MKGKRLNLPLITALCLSVACLSCKETAFYDQYQTVDNVWEKEKEYYFTYEIEDHSALYNITLEIRNDHFYPYQNLWLFCAEEQPVGPARLDTMECILADDYGKWLGHGIFIHHTSIPVRTHYRFPGKGQYSFGIRQGMRDDRLKGIREIGLHIEKVK